MGDMLFHEPPPFVFASKWQKQVWDASRSLSKSLIFLAVCPAKSPGPLRLRLILARFVLRFIVAERGIPLLRRDPIWTGSIRSEGWLR